VATAKEIAEWMMARIPVGMYMYQETVAYEIASRFGNNFTYYNHNGNLAIGTGVLKEFRKLTRALLSGTRANDHGAGVLGMIAQGGCKKGICARL